MSEPCGTSKLKRENSVHSKRLLKTEEAKLGQLVQQQAEERLLKANMAAEKIAQNKAFRIQKALEDEKNYELHCERVKTEAKKNNRIAQQFLRTTLMKNQKKQNIAERLKKAHMKKRMDTMISLKKNIAINQEIMKKLMAWDKAKKYLDKQKKDTEREAILAEGGDDIKLLLHRKQKRDLENKKRIFAEEQRLRKCEIVNRLLKEEAYDEKIKQRQQDLESGKSWRIKAKKLPSQKERTWNYLMDLCDGKTRVRTPVLKINRAISDFAYPRSMSIISTESSMTGDLDTLLVNLEEETLAEPEIMGLWNEAYKPYNLPKDEVERKPLGGTKMDQDIFAGTLEKLRRGIVHRQVVSGREFKGCPFYSKPDLIHFKNFDIGKRYKKKMTLINASYTINYCKLVGVDEHLKDFITIDFDPPGGMSAGISCEVVIIFKPMINKDLHGRVTFLAQTGEFSVPLKCTTKKCLLFLENKLINFGTYVVGETAVQTITLGNRGALGTQFYVRSKIETPDFGTKSPNVIASSLYSLDDRSVDDKSKSTEAFCIPSIDIIPAASPATSEYLSDDLYQDQSISIEEILSERVPSSIYDEQTEIKLGEIRTNDIKPFGSVQIPVIFTPTIPGPSEAKFQIFFKNPDCRPLFFRAIGVAIIVPVWVPRPNVDMKICMYDRLYQEAIIIQTR
ncbi:cilia- and flagella-associated protein 74 [Monodelphis domestica]|uniref:cilia- and flagella-associated protein 74 n=1 Tax=Monodelphis domestica TaxID=13616 RepID=UPI0024E22C1E|nr:cilia- and flagella-associated protein 74 [Monodelphis domestica]XP_056651980.1 cilia- and flagella-associated protein 74 [Monodelphis domestica]XP_056651981.1 cilia- and flagella-associated protein 74 [Monodelphis domestica]XP_056651982.1 cilia- and flagella-associated protein 74 [Monodelphis domestica]